MPSRLIAILGFLALLTPSAWFAWENRDMPQLGRAHDDAIYLSVAKSVADGDGYRIQALPGAPVETKYPPVVIWLLALVWKIAPRFPENLALASALAWAAIPPFLLLTLAWLARAGLSDRARWGAVALLAVGPYTVSFGTGVYTEVLFGVCLLGWLLLAERGGSKWAALAGALAGIGFLTRSVGIAALVAAPAVFLVRRQRREAAAFFGAMLGFVAGWMVWVKLNRPPAVDIATLYNTDYVGFLLKELQPGDAPTLVWQNLGRMLYAIGGLAFPMETGSMLVAMLRVTVAIAALHALWRHRENPALHFYGAFAALTVGELLVWNFPPNLRLMYPLVPLFLVGLVWEAQHFRAMLRSTASDKDASQRFAAKLIGAAAALLAVYGLWGQVTMSSSDLPAQAAGQRQIREDSEAAFAWIGQHSAPGTNVIALNPALYLYAGRRTQSLFALPIYWYRGDSEHILDPFRGLPDSGAAYPMDLLYLHEADYEQLAPGQGAEARRLVKANPALIPVFESGQGTVYRLDHARLARSARQ